MLTTFSYSRITRNAILSSDKQSTLITRSRRRLFPTISLFQCQRTNACMMEWRGELVERRTQDSTTSVTPVSNTVRSRMMFFRVFPSQKCCADSLSVFPSPVCIRTHKNDHIKDPVVHVRVRWITKTRTDPASRLTGRRINCTSVQQSWIVG